MLDEVQEFAQEHDSPRFAREDYNMKHRAKHSCKLHCQGDVGVWCAEVGRTQGRSLCLLRFVKVFLRP